MDSESKVYIVVLNYNGWSDTQECLESLFNLEYKNYDIVVVDNCSNNDSMHHLIMWAEGNEEAVSLNPELSRLCKPEISKPLNYVVYESDNLFDVSGDSKESVSGETVVFIQSKENRGFAAGNNIATKFILDKGDASYIWFLNNDTIVEPDSLIQQVNFFKDYNSTKKVGIVGSKLMYYHDPEVLQAVGGKYNRWFARAKHIGAFEKDHGQYDDGVVGRVDYPVGASMLVSVEFIKDVGLMCEDYFLYFEELDWACRGRALGWEVGYCFRSKIYHKEGASTKASHKFGETSSLGEYYSLRNRLRFTRKFYPRNLILVRLDLIYSILKKIFRGRFDAALSIMNILIRH